MRKWLIGAIAVGVFVAVATPGFTDERHGRGGSDVKRVAGSEVGSQYRRYRHAYRTRAYYPRGGYYRHYVAPRAYYPSRAYSYAPFAGYAYPALPQYLGGSGYRAYRYAPFISLAPPVYGLWF